MCKCIQWTHARRPKRCVVDHNTIYFNQLTIQFIYFWKFDRTAIDKKSKIHSIQMRKEISVKTEFQTVGLFLLVLVTDFSLLFFLCPIRHCLLMFQWFRIQPLFSARIYNVHAEHNSIWFAWISFCASMHAQIKRNIIIIGFFFILLHTDNLHDSVHLSLKACFVSFASFLFYSLNFDCTQVRNKSVVSPKSKNIVIWNIHMEMVFLQNEKWNKNVIPWHAKRRIQETIPVYRTNEVKRTFVSVTLPHINFIFDNLHTMFFSHCDCKESVDFWCISCHFYFSNEIFCVEIQNGL